MVNYNNNNNKDRCNDGRYYFGIRLDFTNVLIKDIKYDIWST